MSLPLIELQETLKVYSGKTQAGARSNQPLCWQARLRDTIFPEDPAPEEKTEHKVRSILPTHHRDELVSSVLARHEYGLTPSP